MSCHVLRLVSAVFIASSLLVGQTQESKPQKPDDKTGKPSGSSPITVVTAADSSKTELPADFKPLVGLDKRPKLEKTTEFQLIQLFNAEIARVRKPLPLGTKDIVVTPDGAVRPGDARLNQLASTVGAAAKVGDQVKITSIVFREKSVYIEVNGGPKRKSKWYEHISISGMGGTAGGQDPNQAAATGSAISLEFKNHVPEMNAAELRQLLYPIFDFSLKSASQVATETLPPKVQAAVKSHQVLVGMNRDMVILAKERPPQKVREKDEKGHEYEDWIYGKPPEEVVFVRFVGDEVTQVKTAKVGGEMVVKTEREIDVKDGVASLASVKPAANNGNQPAEQQQPTRKPTLRRDDDPPDPVAPTTTAPGLATQQHKKEEPQWGEKPPTTQQPPPSQPPPA